MDGTQQITLEQTPGSAPAVVVQKGKPVRRKRGRRMALLAAAAVVLIGGGVYGKYWWTTGRFMESTDDAYTAADAATVAPRVSGQVSEVLVTDNQRVSAGQVIARLDDRDYRASLAQAGADIASAQADIQNLDAQITLQQSTIAQARSSIDSSQAGLEFAQQDFARYQALMKTGAGTVQRAQQADTDIRQKGAALTHDRASLEAALRQVDVLQAQRAKAAAALGRAQANAEQARLNLSYTTITAPIDGAVGDRALRQGQYVSPGTKLLDIVPIRQGVYVVANFKETQLAQMLRGERAELAVDMLGGRTLHGRIDSLAPGSGAQFALLPPENATGNFTKIVQRVPVKILIEDADEATLAQLRPGLSVTATIDTRTAPPGAPQTLVDEAPAPRVIAAARQ